MGLRTQHEELFSPRELSAGDPDSHQPKEEMSARVRCQGAQEDWARMDRASEIEFLKVFVVKDQFTKKYSVL